MEILKVDYNEIKARQLLKEYLELSGSDYIPPFTSNDIEALLTNYILSIGTPNEKIFNMLFKKYNYNYAFSIINSLSYLFGKGKEVQTVSPLSFPGIHGIKQLSDSLYELDTEIGIIEVYKASEFFKDTNSSFIFKKKRVHQCYNRTYDFVKKNRDFDAVVTKMPNAFIGGYQHAYAIKDDILVDPAINCILINKSFIDKIYSGEIVARFSYKEIESRFTEMKENDPSIDNGCILYDVTFNYKK